MLSWILPNAKALFLSHFLCACACDDDDDDDKSNNNNNASNWVQRTAEAESKLTHTHNLSEKFPQDDMYKWMNINSICLCKRYTRWSFSSRTHFLWSCWQEEKELRLHKHSHTHTRAQTNWFEVQTHKFDFAPHQQPQPLFACEEERELKWADKRRDECTGKKAPQFFFSNFAHETNKKNRKYRKEKWINKIVVGGKFWLRANDETLFVRSLLHKSSKFMINCFTVDMMQNK